MFSHHDRHLLLSLSSLKLPYSDGASFAGYRSDPWKVPADPDTGVPAGATVTFRGIKNFDGAIDFAMKHGMADATEFVLTGGRCVSTTLLSLLIILIS